jgi:D-alanyl-lipoteichoic acid acyltransferase DltB (MBOAT superfamily)
LSTWLRDYLYRPLGGNRRGAARTSVNLLATMLLGGLWHGASWHFVVWGAWHGLGLLVCRAWMQYRESRHIIKAGIPSPEGHGKHEFSSYPLAGSKVGRASCSEAGVVEGRRFMKNLKVPLSWLATMIFVFYGWLLFRAESMSDVISLTMALADWRSPEWLASYAIRLGGAAVPLVLMQIWQARAGNLLAPLGISMWLRSCLEGFLLWAILVFWQQDSTAFIYFQF